MNLKQFQERAFTDTEKDVADSVRLMLANYNEAEKRIIAEIERNYGKYLDTVDPADYYNIMIKHDRLTKLLSQVQAEYNTLYSATEKSVRQIAGDGMRGMYGRQSYILEWISPMPITFSPLDPRLVELTVTGTLKSWNDLKRVIDEKTLTGYVPQYGTLSDLLKRRRINDIAKIHTEITQSIIQGNSARDTARAIRGTVAEHRYNAERIARTELTRTMNLGAQESYRQAENAGVNIEKMWLATLDTRTRPAHQALDGQKANAEGLFTYNGETARGPGQWASAGMNINCRCTTVPIVEGQEPTLRRGRNPETGENEVFSFKTYTQWAEGSALK